MRILFIGLNYAPERTGIAPYTSGMAEWLAAAGHRVRAITAFPHYPEWRFTDDDPTRQRLSTRRGGVNVLRLRHRLPTPKSSISRVRSELSFGWRALLSRWGRADVVVLVSPALFASALIAPFVRIRRGSRLVVWVQDLYGPGVRETNAGDRFGIAERLVARTERALLRGADAVVVIHDRMVDEVVARGVDPSRVEVVRNWSHVSRTSMVARDRMRARVGWSPGQIVVLHTGNMGAKQALGSVVESARLADRTGVPVWFVLMGDGNTRADLEQEAQGVRNVVFMEAVPAEQYLDLLRAADILLINEHPLLVSTALPSKLTSYFASGRPVIAATNVGSLTAAEITREDTALRIDPGDPQGLLDSVIELSADPRRMRAFAARARRYRRDHLTEQAAAQRFSAVLERVRGGEAARVGDHVQRVGPRSAGSDEDVKARVG